MDLLKTIGIIYVLSVHYYVPKIFHYPIGSFLLSLFFFISGYFFKSIDGFRLKLIYCAQKTKELMWPYFLYQISFTIICYFLQVCLSINLTTTYWDLDLLQYPMVLLLKPLFGGNSIVFVTSWFITDLWLILIFMQFIYNNKSNDKKIDFVYFVCFLLITLVNIKWSYTSPRPTTPQNTFNYLQHSLFKRIFIRTSFSLLFLFCGIIYRAHIEKYQKLLFTGINFCLAFIIICQLDYYHNNNIYFHHFNAEFSSAPIWLPILTSIIGIYMFMFLAKCVSKHIDDNDILLKIGQYLPDDQIYLPFSPKKNWIPPLPSNATISDEIDNLIRQLLKIDWHERPKTYSEILEIPSICNVSEIPSTEEVGYATRVIDNISSLSLNELE
ncbi:unnamed protein product [Rotaria sp. Silwood1]|nr:unnamed protein product [Rotaria sp. Silwood1]